MFVPEGKSAFTVKRELYYVLKDSGHSGRDPPEGTVSPLLEKGFQLSATCECSYPKPKGTSQPLVWAWGDF